MTVAVNVPTVFAKHVRVVVLVVAADCGTFRLAIGLQVRPADGTTVKFIIPATWL